MLKKIALAGIFAVVSVVSFNVSSVNATRASSVAPLVSVGSPAMGGIRPPGTGP